MVTATYALEVDWNNDGLFTHANTDVTTRTLAIECRRGRDFASQLTGHAIAGTLHATLNNTSGDYSPFNTSSPLYGKLIPGIAVRLRATYSGTTYTLWHGYLTTLMPQTVSGPWSTAELSAQGGLAKLSGKQINPAASSGALTGTIVGDILDAAGWPKNLIDYVVNDLDNVVAAWAMDEQSGNYIDRTPNTNDGVLTAGAGTRAGTTVDDGLAYALDLDGTATRVAVPHAAALAPNTFSVFAFFTQDVNGGTLVAKGRADLDTYYFLGYNGAGTLLVFDVRTADPASSRVSVTAPATGGRHIAVGTYTSGAQNLTLINLATGAVTQATAAAPTGNVNITANSLGIGCNFQAAADGSPSGFFNGRIGPCGVTSDVLSLAEQKAMAFRAAVAPRDLDAGATTTSAWYIHDKDALQATREIEETELGVLFEDADQTLLFQARDFRLNNAASITSQVTFSDAGAATHPYMEIMEVDPFQQIWNEATAEIKNYTTQSLAVLWTLTGETPTLLPGQARTFTAVYPDTGTTTGAYVNAWTTPVVGTDITQTGVANGDIAVVAVKAANTMAITITNNHTTATATLTLVRARGTAVTQGTPVQMSALNAASQTTYGKRTFHLPGPWLPNTDEAQNFCDYVVSRYKDPHAVLAIQIADNRSDGLMTQALTRKLSDRVTVTATGNARLGVNEDFYIEAISHRIAPGKFHVSEFELSPASGDGGYWVLGTSELDTDTKLFF